MKTLDYNSTLVDLTVRSMLNPNNKDFYIGSITIDQVKELLTGLGNSAIDMFWTAFGIASAVHYKKINTVTVKLNEKGEF